LGYIGYYMVWLGYLYVPITNEPRNSPGNRTGRCETRAAHNSTWTAASSQLQIVGGYFIHLQKCDSLKYNATCKSTKKKMVCSAFPLIVIKIQYCKQIVTQEMRVAIRNDFDNLIQGLPVKTKWHVSLNLSLSLYPAIITHRDKNLCQISHMLMNLDSMRDSYCITLGYRIYQVGSNLPHFAPHISEVQGARGGHFRSRHHGRANLS
jgi:hypothetical protein